MLEFKNIELSDKEILEPYLRSNPYGNCDFSFTNIYMWRIKYHTRYCLWENYLILRGKGGVYLMPLRKEGTEENLRPVLEAMIADDMERGVVFCLAAVTPLMREHLEEAIPGRFHFEEDRDSSDYLYAREKLVNLAGKKLHSKRNHINKFRALYPDATFEPITPDNMQEVVDMHRKWCEVNDFMDHDDLMEEGGNVRDVLNNYEALDVRGGLLRVDGRVVAFSVGQPINNQVFDVIIEKAFYDVPGAYTVINQQFAEHCTKGYAYLNREEDLGIEGLRKAKMSYYPDILLDKGRALLKCDVEAGRQWVAHHE